MKRILFLASLATAAAPLSGRALDGEVTVYGTVMPFVDNARVTGATATAPVGGATQLTKLKTSPYNAYGNVPQRFRLTAGTSNFGLKGGLDLLGEDLQVFFQIENTIQVDGGDLASTLAGRNTGVGLKGNFGRLLLGSWDTPYKMPILAVGTHRGLDPFDNAIIGTPGFGVPATTTQSGRAAKSADAAFNRRQGNSIQYWSPEYHGLSGRLAVSVNEGKTPPADVNTPSVSPLLYSGTVSYVYGPMTLRYAFERHQDYFGLTQMGGSAVSWANHGSTDDGHLASAQVSLPTNTKLSVMAERLSYENDDQTAGAVKRYSRWAGYALVQQRFDAHQLFASYGLADKGKCAVNGTGTCTTKGLGASQLSVGYSYSLGKSFETYAAYYQMVNDRSASYAVVNGPGTVTPGGDTRGFGVGFLYTFAATATAGTPKGL